MLESAPMMHRRTYPNLRRFLRETETTQKTLASRVGVDQSTIAHILSGRRKPSWTLAKKLAKVANVPLDSVA